MTAPCLIDVNDDKITLHHHAFYPTSSHQYGSGGITVFRGSPIPHVQYGRGLVSLFKSAARVVKPLAARVVRYAGRRGLETGIGILTDVLSGEDVKTAAKRRASAAFQQAKQDVLAAVKEDEDPLLLRRQRRLKEDEDPLRRLLERKEGRVGRRVDASCPWFADDGYLWIKQRHEGLSFPHTLRSCEDHCCSRCQGIRASPETLRIVPWG